MPVRLCFSHSQLEQRENAGGDGAKWEQCVCASGAVCAFNDTLFPKIFGVEYVAIHEKTYLNGSEIDVTVLCEKKNL